MNETVQMWLFGAAFGLIGAQFMLWWAHVQRCTDRDADAAKVEVKMENIEKEIGDHEHGIIGQLHRYSKAITRIFAKIGLKE